MATATRIGQLHIIGSNLHPRTAQRRTRQVLGRLDLRPPGLPAEAIFCVRHFRDPLPGTFSLQSNQRSALRQWQKAANAELTRLYRAAYVPVRQPVPPSAQAVLFHTQAEVLSCLAQDWLTGRILGRWWWQHWLKNRSVAEAVHHSWLDQPLHIPPAFAHLEPNQRIAFVQQLPPPIVQRLTRLLVQTFAIPPIILSDETFPHLETESGITPGQQTPRPSQETSFSESPNLSDKASPVAPFSLDWLPELTTSGLTTAQRRFLILVTALVRRPRLVRQREFALFVADYLSRSSLASKSPKPDSPSFVSPPEAPSTEIAARKSPCAGSEHDTAKTAVPEADQPDPEITSVTAIPHSGDTAATRPTMPKLAATTAILPTTQKIETTPAAPTPSTQWIETAFGGLFYSINVVLYLKLYGDFSTPREPGLELPLWDFLALLGETWFGLAFREDALWTVLATLADRPPEHRPGLDISAPDTWRLSPQALRAFPEDGIWSWRIDAERLYVWHPAGFCLLDVPAEGDITAQLATETSPYTTPFTLSAADSLILDSALAGWPRWFNWLLPFLEARLKRAFTSNDQPADKLCRYPARIIWTDSHLDIYFKLDDINLSLRQAGLDRNPGWVPIAGRFIAFHFD